MKSNAEAAIYVNNTNADGNGNGLMMYLNADKSRSAKATGAIVDSKGNIDNTDIKKIKGRGNTTWDKPKKAYNITYSDAVSIAGMKKGKKYSILANYQDDSLEADSSTTSLMQSECLCIRFTICRFLCGRLLLGFISDDRKG